MVINELIKIAPQRTSVCGMDFGKIRGRHLWRLGTRSHLNGTGYQPGKQCGAETVLIAKFLAHQRHAIINNE